MAMQSSKKVEFNEINITPLTDIFLVLLIIMMVIAPMFQTVDKNIIMPEITSGADVNKDKITVAITKDAEFFINDAVINPTDLESSLIGFIAKSKDKTVVVKADTTTKNKEIMKVMRAAQAAGYEKLTVAGEPLSAKQQDDLRGKNKMQESVTEEY